MTHSILKTRTAPKRTAGFTLVEMAIVILILGLMIGSVASAYTMYQKHLKVENTKTDIKTLSDAIGEFRSLYGRYPCPASLTATRDETNYGREDCNAMITSDIGDKPEDNVGIGIQASTRTTAPGTFFYQKPNHNGTEFTGTFTPTDNNADPMRVATGGVPFRNLNMEEDQAYDGYGNRIVYAVTEHLAFSDAFQATGGGIEIRDDDDSSALGKNTADAGTAHFIIFSPGKNEAGAYNRGGTQYTCPTTGFDNENCDFDDSVFRVARTSDGDASRHHDDVMSYFTQKEVPLWQLSEADNHGADVHAKSGGEVGFGIDHDSITEEAHINNTLRVADDDPDDDVPGGKLQTEELCVYNGDDSECFKSSLIGGMYDPANPKSGGMGCLPGQFMAGIKYGEPICRDEVVLKCPTGTYMIGIHDDGKPRCDEAPPDGCGKKDVPLCNTTDSIGPGKHGDKVTAHAGDSRKQVYECDEGTWKKIGGESGLCNCTESTGSPQSTNCSNISEDECGKPWTGTQIKQTSVSCPGGQEHTTIIKACDCVGSSKPGTQDCPSDFNEGRKHGNYVFSCSNKQCKFELNPDGNKCRCVPDEDTQETNCPNNFSGTYTEIKYFTCPNGNQSPGKWDKNWQEKPGAGKAERCTCQEGPGPTTTESCPDGYEGEKRTPSTIRCVNGQPSVVPGETVNDCKAIPEPSCKWNRQGTAIRPGNLGRRHNDPCTCGTDPSVCSSGGQVYSCVCN